MSLTHKALSTMGIEPDKIDQILVLHRETIDSIKADKDAALDEIEKYKKKAEKLDSVQKELDTLKEQIAADAKSREGKDYDKLKEEFDNYKTEIENKAVRASKEAAYKDILKDAGIPEKHFAKVLKYSDVDSVELDDNGKIKDAKEILKAIKEEWSDHIETSGKQGAGVATPPANNGGSGKTKEEIMAIKDTAQRQQAMVENPELFGLG